MKEKITPKLEKLLAEVEVEILAGKVSGKFKTATAFLASLKR